MRKYWLMKTEPKVYSIDELKKEKVAGWEGIRNYQARNFMRDDMQVGDKVFIYHSNSKPSGIAGTARVHKKAYPDHYALNKKSKYFFAKATKENNPWVMVDVKFEKKFKDLVSLNDLKDTKGLEKMRVIQRGQRLSIQPVSQNEFEIIEKKFG